MNASPPVFLPKLTNPFTDYSHLKAFGKPEGSLPLDVGATLPPRTYTPHTHTQIILEALLGLSTGILGASLNAPSLKEVTWSSEMKVRYVYTHVICISLAETFHTDP